MPERSRRYDPRELARRSFIRPLSSMVLDRGITIDGARLVGGGFRGIGRLGIGCLGVVRRGGGGRRRHVAEILVRDDLAGRLDGLAPLFFLLSDVGERLRPHGGDAARQRQNTKQCRRNQKAHGAWLVYRLDSIASEPSGRVRQSGAAAPGSVGSPPRPPL